MTAAASRQYHASSLDILKGLSLLALLLVNCNHWFAPVTLPGTAYEQHKSLADLIAGKFIDYFIMGQCYALLAFLLGIQFFNSSKRESSQQRTDYLRRYLILLLVGLAHQLLWSGDVLFVYALSGMLLVFLEKKGANVALLLGLLFISNLPGFFASLFVQLIHGKPPEHSAAIAAANADYFGWLMEKGSFLQLLVFNIGNILPKYKYQLLSGQLFRVAGFFVLGFYAGRINLLEQVRDHARFFGLMLMACFFLFLSMLYLQLSLFRQTNILILDPVKGMVDNMQHVFGVAAYLLTGILLLQFYAVKRLLHPIAAVGQMWVSNYLFQTAAGILLFYNVAFKLYPETGPLTNVIFALSIFIVQVIASNIWRHYFYHGPFEWLWRSAAAYRWRRFYKGKRGRN